MPLAEQQRRVLGQVFAPDGVVVDALGGAEGVLDLVRGQQLGEALRAAEQ